MHPAFSVVFFTTATGAGYGLLALLGVLAGQGFIPPDFWLGLVGMGLALGLIAAGLLSSTGHLGRPERAWRAFSQWRSSWLSREGVASVTTFIPAGLFGIGWVLLGRTGGWVAIAGLLAAIGAIVTVCTTSMIYASLKPIAQWHSRFTLPGYLIFSAMTGSVLLNALLQSFGMASNTLLAGCAAADLARRGLEAGDMAVQRHVGDCDQRQHRHRAGRWHGAVAGMAAYRGKLPAQGNGLSHRAQAQRAAAPDHAGSGLRSARRCC